jgi:hypothetical protein
MKGLSVSIAILAICGSALGNVTTYTETLDIYRTQAYDGGFNPGAFYWFHQNPSETPIGPMTPAQYELAVTGGHIDDVTLSITIDDLNQGDRVDAWILDRYNTLQYLGELQPMTASTSLGIIHGDGANTGHRSVTNFEIEPGWLDGLPVKIQLAGNSGSIEIETSTLSVTTVFPIPGTIFLGGIGVCLVGLLRRKSML